MPCRLSCPALLACCLTKCWEAAVRCQLHRQLMRLPQQLLSPGWLWKGWLWKAEQSVSLLTGAPDLNQSR